MSSNTLIFNDVNKAESQTTPISFPARYQLLWEGPGEFFYGVNGEPPVIPIPPGGIIVIVERNALQLKWDTYGDAKLSWKEV